MASDPPQDPRPEAPVATEPVVAEPVVAEPVSPAKEWAVAIALMLVLGFMAFEFIEYLRHASSE